MVGVGVRVRARVRDRVSIRVRIIVSISYDHGDSKALYGGLMVTTVLHRISVSISVGDRALLPDFTLHSVYHYSDDKCLVVKLGVETSLRLSGAQSGVGALMYMQGGYRPCI